MMTLQDRLAKFEKAAREWTEEDGRPKHLFLNMEETASEATKLIEKDILELIGENEVHPIKHYSTWKISTRNKLKSELRLKLKEYFK